MIIAGVVAVAALALVLALILLHNAMVRGRNLAEEAWSGINVQLRRRHDLVPLLVSTVQGYAAHEKEVFLAVARAREAGMKVSGGSAHDVGEAEKGLSLALGRLLAVAEACPELKASENFLELQRSLAGLEDDIQMARRYYNGTVREQNNRIMQFPGNLVAARFGFHPMEYFEPDGGDEVLPQGYVAP
ncbi:LemA family protein [Mailhella massiliensis]|uniref:LemA family protein n=1 Tax=Mailhella massiliensis TaxID=1903261 RepID=A0A921AVS3_9BACT|nr:LemA family protein [Mailhella massiliensis]HJD96658.1 LemA family protein [Mailhella massiliensis]